MLKAAIILACCVAVRISGKDNAQELTALPKLEQLVSQIHLQKRQPPAPPSGVFYNTLPQAVYAAITCDQIACNQFCVAKYVAAQPAVQGTCTFTITPMIYGTLADSLQMSGACCCYNGPITPGIQPIECDHRAGPGGVRLCQCHNYWCNQFCSQYSFELYGCGTSNNHMNPLWSFPHKSKDCNCFREDVSSTPPLHIVLATSTGPRVIGLGDGANVAPRPVPGAGGAGLGPAQPIPGSSKGSKGYACIVPTQPAQLQANWESCFPPPQRDVGMFICDPVVSAASVRRRQLPGMEHRRPKFGAASKRQPMWLADAVQKARTQNK